MAAMRAADPVLAGATKRGGTMKAMRRALFVSATLLLSACVDREPTLPPMRAAAGGGGGGVSVTATDPDSATQDTTLDVVVSGSGFDQGSQAQWAIAGVPSAKVHTNSTRFVTSKKLIANITIALDAVTGLYDVMVTASTGKKGIGSELFAVNKKGSGVGSVSVSPSAATIMVLTSIQLTATVYDVEGNVLPGRPVTWSSSDPSVASVTSDGTVSGLASGTVIISAVREGHVGTATVIVQGLSFSAVHAASGFTCGVGAGTAYCWGNNYFGQLGDGSTTNRTTPVRVQGVVLYQMIAGGSGHTCGVAVDGRAFCWGTNADGQLGNGSKRSSVLPIAVAGGLYFNSVTLSYHHTCALAVDGRAYCWGRNTFGQLGAGTTVRHTTPNPVTGGLTFTSIDASGQRTCAVTAGGAAYCWGPGLTGDGTKVGSTVPVAVSGGHRFVSVDVSDGHNCGLADDGSAYCWGLNTSGQLGNVTTDTCNPPYDNPCSTIPIPVLGAPSFTSVTAGGSFTCGLASDGRAYCWGGNGSGQLGDGSTTDRSTPAPVVGGLLFASISAGGSQVCAITTNGVAYCWGGNNEGELGDGTGVSSPVPVRVRGQE